MSISVVYLLKSVSFFFQICAAYEARISLSATGFYK